MPTRTRRIVRRAFRWSCRLVVLAVLAILILLIYLEKAGIPDFLKERMVEELRARGWEVDFSSLRFHWYRGIIAENMHLQRVRHKPGPIIFVDEALCRLDRNALRNLEVELESVQLHGGRVLWPFSETNKQTATFRLDRIGGELVFLANDLWELRSLSADLLGVNVQVSGMLTNASLVRDWTFPKFAPESAVATDALWRRIVATAGRVKFAGVPQLLTRFGGDARDLRKLNADLRFVAPGLETPWAHATNSVLHIRVFPARESEPLQADLELSAEDPATQWCRARKVRVTWEVEAPFISLFPANEHFAVDLISPETPWAKARHAVATIRVSPERPDGTDCRTEVQASLEHLQSEWGRSDNSQLSVEIVHSGTNFYPSSFSTELRLSRPRTKWGDAAGGVISVTTTLPPAGKLDLLNTNLVWPERFKGIAWNGSILATNLLSKGIKIEHVACEAAWNEAHLNCRTDAALYGGGVRVTAQLDSVTREVLFSGDSAFDYLQAIDPLLTPNTKAWFLNCEWQNPPHVRAEGRVVLPVWTNHHPDWVRGVRPTLSLAGAFELGRGACRGIDFNSATSSFGLSNSVWTLTDLRVTRPDGELTGNYSSSMESHDFHWQLRSALDPKNIRPLLDDESARQGLDYFKFTQPPDVEGVVWGRWDEPERLGFAGRFRATNFTFRGESIASCDTSLYYTNKLLFFIDPILRESNHVGTADKIMIDFVKEKLYLTNATGNLNPYAIARAIGQYAIDAIGAYQFDSPPHGRVNGVIDLKGGRHQDDLHFVIDGGPFHWQQFRLRRLAGNVDWVGDKLTLSEVSGAFRNGEIAGAAAFDFGRGPGTTFAFNLGVSNADLRTTMVDIGYSTNLLEGILNGEMFIRSANTSDPNSWQGEGRLELHDGLIWNIPMFGIFSPVLNSFVPGLGNSRAKNARATFVVTNSVFVSHNLDIRATAMRMEFDGSIDFDGRVDARIDAVLLRDLPAIGFIVSKMLWPMTKLFESRLTGAVNHPKSELVYTIPKLLLMPLRPIKTLKEMFPEEPKTAPK